MLVHGRELINSENNKRIKLLINLNKLEFKIPIQILEVDGNLQMYLPLFIHF